jgi:hypothetical protein
MWIDESRGRIIDFLVSHLNPLERFPMRLWLRVISDAEIATRHDVNGEERRHEVTLSDGKLVLKNVGGEFELRRLPESEYPEWLDEMVAASNAKMDEKEKQN